MDKPMSEKHRVNISELRKRTYQKRYVEEGNPTPALWKKWKIKNIRLEEYRKKMSDALKGKKKSEETKKKISKSLVGRFIGEKSPSWKGGENSNTVRREIKRKNGGVHTKGDWETLKAQYNWTCPSCKKSEPEVKLTKDHIVPVSKGGSDNIENIQPLCGSCNSTKHTQILKYGS